MIPGRFIKFIKKSLFLNNLCAIRDFIFIFFLEYVSFNNDLCFGEKKFFGGKTNPGTFAGIL